MRAYEDPAERQKMWRQWKADEGRRKEEKEGEDDGAGEEAAGREGKGQNKRER